jgi:thiopeptide-type bacteriocin biosynthesis protein
MEIDTKSKEDSEKLIRSFVRNSVREMQSEGIIESFHFFRYTPKDKVRLRLLGKRKEAEELLAAQIQTWIIDGVVISYRFNDYGLEAQKFGERGSEMASKLFEIGSRAALDYADKFPDMIQPIDTTRERRTPVGTWILIHTLLQNIGHDSADEMNACLFAIQNRIDFLAQTDKKVATEAANRLVQILAEKKQSLEDRALK